MRSVGLLLVLSLVAACWAETSDDALLEVSTPAFVMGRVLLPPKVLKRGSGVRVLVDGEHATYARHNGSFLLNLMPGVRIVDFAVRDYLMPQLRIDVSRKTPGKYRAVFNDKNRHIVVEPLEVEPLAMAPCFEQREAINWIGFLRSPHVLIMVFGLGMAVLMPMMIDPEEMKQMKQSGGIMEMLKKAAEDSQKPQQQIQAPAQAQRPRVKRSK
ncbi:ER membrane protein complex subunit 7-like protein [Diplonema papillatum]|nr:ER membrane protein complex subunit 7-like protein [Diplonema papillatum]